MTQARGLTGKMGVRGLDDVRGVKQKVSRGGRNQKEKMEGDKAKA